MEQVDNLEELLALHTGRCVEDEAKYFLSLDVTGIEYNEKIKRRMLRYAFKRSRYERRPHAAKVLLAACIVAMAAAFCACMTIPEIRQAMWKATTEWFGDHIAVRFEADTDALPVAESLEEDAVVPPTTIEQKAYATYLPEGYTANEKLFTSKCLIINYLDADGTQQFKFSQIIRNSEGWLLDNEDVNIITIRLQNCQAVLIEDSENPNKYSLTWADDFYTYNLTGNFSSLSELIKIAESYTLY